MSETFSDAVEALLVATPEPPAADCDPAEILIEGERALTLRAPLIEIMRSLAPPPGVTHAPGVAERFATIIDRDARWTAAMTRARAELAGRMRGVRRFRNTY